MLGGLNGVGASLASVYSQNSSDMAEVYSRIATGKKINKPTDDFSGYIRAQSMDTEIKMLQDLKPDLIDAKSAARVAVDSGTAVLEDLSRMKELANVYAAGTADQQLSYKSEFNALKSSVNETLTNTKYDGASVFGAVALASPELNTAGDTLQVKFVVADYNATADITALDITDGGVAADVDAEIEIALGYVNKAASFDKAIDRNLSLNDTIVANKQAAMSSLTDINDIEEMGKATDLQIRQQAAISMMAQANMSRQGIMKLYV